MTKASVVSLSSPAAEAAAWSERLAEAPDGPGLRDAFQRWLDDDPANAEAFADIENALSIVRESRLAEPIIALREETAARLAARRSDPWRRAAIAASLLVVTLLGGLMGWFVFQRAPSEPPGIYATGIGERVSVTLSDGSVVTLNTRSRVRTEYSRGARRLYLESGQAVFEVAKDPRRPFVVLAGGQAITAHGTTFDVYLRPKALEVALIEGGVVVRPDRVPNSIGTRMAPGQMLTLVGDTAPLTQIRKLDYAASWREGLVFFDDTTLGEAVAEMNRYSRKAIKLADPELSKLRLSGSFRTDGADLFVEALQNYFPLKVARSDATATVLAARN